MDLTTSQWSLLSPLVEPEVKVKHRGRPHQDNQAVLNGVFWVLRTGARWADLPERYPPHQTCHRRFREWVANGTLERCFQVLAADLARKDDSARAEPHAVGPTRPNVQTRSVAVGPRSWRWHTATLLQCSLAQQALGKASVGPPAANDTEPFASAGEVAAGLQPQRRRRP